MSNWRRVVLSGLMLLVTLSQPLLAAERVISLAPSLTEMMLDLHSADKLVGLLDGGPRPEGLVDVPSVGDFAQFEMETLLSLQPDLILYWPGSISAIQLTQLQQLDVPIFTARATTMDELALQFAELGKLLGAAEYGAELTAQSQQKLLQMRTRYQREAPLRVFYQVWDSPMYTLGGEQIITDAYKCAVRKIFMLQVSIESVLARNPMLFYCSERLAPMWQAWPVLRAVQRQQVLEVPDHGLERPSLQMFAALELLCEHLADFQ